MTRLVLAAALLLTMSGCNIMSCNGAATNGAEAAGCGLHTTFLAVRSHGARPFVSTKS